MKVQITDARVAKQLNLSKHRNSQSQSLSFIDDSGKKILGHPMKHFIQVSQLQQTRFNTKFEAFSLLTKNELKELFAKLPKDKIKGNTDKAALVQAYYNASFEAFKDLSNDELDAYNGTVLDNLDDVEKQALIDAKDIISKEKQLVQ